MSTALSPLLAPMLSSAPMQAACDDAATLQHMLDFESALWPPPPRRDLSVSDGEKVVLGDTTVTIHLTPGHTVGTVSPTFDVRDASGVHRALLWGGTSFNFGRKLAEGRPAEVMQHQEVVKAYLGSRYAAGPAQG